MTKQNYVDSCVEEALKKAGGNKSSATQILLARSAEDKLLEDGLFAAFRESATMYHVQRVAHKLDGKSAAPTPKKIDGGAFDNMLSQLRQNLGGKSKLESSLQPATSKPVNKSEGSAEHGNSLRKLAGAFRKKPNS